MKHLASDGFWRDLSTLPESVQELAKKNIKLLKTNPRHPSLRFKKVGEFRSFRIGLGYRALGKDVDEGILWFWIGSHSDYDRMVS